MKESMREFTKSALFFGAVIGAEIISYKIGEHLGSAFGRHLDAGFQARKEEEAAVAKAAEAAKADEEAAVHTDNKVNEKLKYVTVAECMAATYAK